MARTSPGTRIARREADEHMDAALLRADRAAYKDEAARLRERIAVLERDLARARRCLAAERQGSERLHVRLADADRAYSFATEVLCQCAFPGDAADR